MRALLVILLSSSIAFGQAADAPVLPPEGRAMHLQAGETVPFAATCLDDAQALRTAKRVAYAETEAAGLKRGNVIVSTPTFIAIVAGGIVLGIATGAAVAYAAKR